MCWSGPASAVVATIGMSAVGAGAYLKEPKSRYMTVFYFTLMEILQAFTYIWINMCDHPANIWFTRLSFLHICFQIPVVNIFALSFVKEEVRAKWMKPIVIFSLTCSFIMASRMFIPMIWDLPLEWICESWRAVCGADTCSYSGDWHIAWRLILVDFDRHYLLYFLPVFIIPVLIGSWRWSLYHVLIGPLAAQMMTTNNDEMPAIWCLLSIGFVISTHWGPLKHWLETPLRK